MGQILRLLLVDDDVGDVVLMREALKESGKGTDISVVKDGVEAMAYLRRQPPYADAPRSDVILLDLNLPRQGGFEVLAKVKQDPALRAIPVIIVSTSGANADIARAYDLHANLYVTKPVDLEEFFVAVKNLDSFLVHAVKLPDR